MTQTVNLEYKSVRHVRRSLVGQVTPKPQKRLRNSVARAECSQKTPLTVVLTEVCIAKLLAPSSSVSARETRRKDDHRSRRQIHELNARSARNRPLTFAVAMD